MFYEIGFGLLGELVVDVVVKPQWDIELLVVDPLLKGEHRAVIDVKLTVCVLEQSTHMCVVGAEVGNEV